MKDPEEIATIWSEELQIAAKKILAHEVLGTTPAQKKFEVEVELPAPVADAIVKACHATGLDANEVVSGMATEGLNTFLTEKLQQGVKKPEPHYAEAPPIGQPLNSMPSIDQLSAVTGQMSQLAEMMKSVSSTINVLKDQENPQQPDVPNRKVAEGKPGQNSDD